MVAETDQHAEKKISYPKMPKNSQVLSENATHKVIKLFDFLSAVKSSILATSAPELLESSHQEEHSKESGVTEPSNDSNLNASTSFDKLQLVLLPPQISSIPTSRKLSVACPVYTIYADAEALSAAGAGFGELFI